MTIRIEILSVKSDTIRAALYYPVPPADFLPGSADPARKPAGKALPTAEQTALAEGRIIERITSVTLPANTATNRIAKALEDAWRAQAKDARHEYLAGGLKPIPGYSWDGTKWTTGIGL